MKPPDTAPTFANPFAHTHTVDGVSCVYRHAFDGVVERSRMSNRKGDRWERNYVNALSATDSEDDRKWYERVGVSDFGFVEPFTALRLPASGGGRVDDLPDLHVWRRTDDSVVQFAGEVKAGSERVRLDNAEVRALERYAKATKSTPLVFIHIDKRSAYDEDGGDYVVAIDELHSTSKGYTFTKNRDGGIRHKCTGVPFCVWLEHAADLYD